MKYTLKTILVCGGLAAAALPMNTSAGLETEIYTGYHSIYEFRGVELGDDGLWDVGIDLSYDLGNGYSIGGGIWFADSYGSTAVGGDFEEVDYTLSISKTIGKVDVSVGYIYYDFPGSSVYSEEYFIGLSTELENGIGISLTYYDDFDTGGGDALTGEYLELEVTKSWDINECATLDLAVGAAWSFDYNGDVDGSALDGFNHFFVTVGVAWEIYENLTLSPYVKYIAADSDLVSDLSDGSSDDHFYGGVSLSYSF